MARNNRNTNIGVGLDTSGIAEGVAQITGALRGLTAEIGKIGATAQGSVEPVAKAFKQVHDTSGLAGAGVMAMSGIISDANYGIRGIANNLQQFSGLMVTLVSQTGSVTAAFRSLWSALMGPLGIMLAFTTVISIMERFSMKSSEASKETADNTKLTDGNSKALTYAQQVREAYNKSLEDTKATMADVNMLTKEQMRIELANLQNKIIADKETLRLSKENLDAATAEMQNAAMRNRITQDDRDNLKDATAAYVKYQGVVSATEEAIKSYQTALSGNKTGVKTNIQSVQISASDLAMQQIDRDNKAYEQIKENTLQNQQEINEVHDFQADLMEQYWNEPIEYTGEKFEKVKQGLKRDFEQLTQQIQQSVERFIEASIVNLFDALGASVINGSDSLKKFGQEFMGELGVFFQQIGAMLISYGVAMKAFQSSFENPIGLIVAGAALVAIGGAIKAAHKKKFGESAGSSAAMPYTPTATGYANQDGTITLYTRVDGRDLILSADRVGYTQRR